MSKRRRLRVIRNWRDVLRYAWSVKLMVLAGVLAGIEAILPLIPDLLPIPPRVFAALTFVVVMGALVSRFAVQNKLSGDE